MPQLRSPKVSPYQSHPSGSFAAIQSRPSDAFFLTVLSLRALCNNALQKEQVGLGVPPRGRGENGPRRRRAGPTRAPHGPSRLALPCPPLRAVPASQRLQSPERRPAAARSGAEEKSGSSARPAPSRGRRGQAR